MSAGPTGRGDGTVRTLLYEAANVLLVKISRGAALRSWGLAIAQRSGFKKAPRPPPGGRSSGDGASAPLRLVAVARKLAVLLHRLWRDGSEFRWSTEPTAA